MRSTSGDRIITVNVNNSLHEQNSIMVMPNSEWCYYVERHVSWYIYHKHYI